MQNKEVSSVFPRDENNVDSLLNKEPITCVWLPETNHFFFSPNVQQSVLHRVGSTVRCPAGIQITREFQLKV